MLLKMVLLVIFLAGLVFFFIYWDPTRIGIIGAIGAELSNLVAKVLIGKP